MDSIFKRQLLWWGILALNIVDFFLNIQSKLNCAGCLQNSTMNARSPALTFRKYNYRGRVEANAP
jgi:hypothetical protein